MTQPQIVNADDDEIDLYDIVMFLRETWAKLLGTTVAGLFIGFLVVLYAPKSFEARVSVQGAFLDDKSLDDPAVLLEKIKQPTFFSEQTTRICLPDVKTDPAENLIKLLNPSLTRNTPVISLRFRANSRELAQSCLQAVVDEFVRQQNNNAKELIELKQAQLKSLRDTISETQQTLKLINQQLAATNETGSKAQAAPSSAGSSILSLYASTQSDLSRLQSDETKLSASLAFPSTRPATAIAPIYLPQKPIFPKRGLTLLVSSFLGLMLGFAWHMLKRTWVKTKIAHQTIGSGVSSQSAN